MSELELTPEQKAIVLAPVGQPRSLFLHGPAGCGKTTTAVARLRYLLDIGVPGSQIVVWVPQRSLGRPYVSAVRSVTAPNGTPVDVLGLDGLARRLLDLYWPLVAESAGFDPTHPPVYLTLETAQYYLDQVIEPLLQGGAFGDVVLPRNRLLSQIIDNLNKAALVGFTKACARELAPRNITVNLVVPGLIATDMTAIMSDALREEALKRIPLGRAGTAEDVAHMVSFLASERAGYITGSVILVDGGLGM